MMMKKEEEEKEEEEKGREGKRSNIWEIEWRGEEGEVDGESSKGRR